MATLDLHPDFYAMLVEFAREGVESVLIGGYAMAVHGHARHTKDIDFVLEGSPENLGRAARALAHFGAARETVEAVRTLGPTEVAFLGQSPVRVEFLRTIDGVSTPALFEHAITIRTGDLDVRVISRDDLLANKRAAGRLQDLADVAKLEKIGPML